MQPAQLTYLLYAGPKVQVISVSQKNLDTKFLEHILRNTFDRRRGSDRHKDWRLNFSMRRNQTTAPRPAACFGDIKLSGHSLRL
jgi:hypothetical protein